MKEESAADTSWGVWSGRDDATTDGGGAGTHQCCIEFGCQRCRRSCGLYPHITGTVSNPSMSVSLFERQGPSKLLYLLQTNIC